MMAVAILSVSVTINDNGQQKDGKRQNEVHSAPDDGVKLATIESGKQPERYANEHRQQDRWEPDGEENTASVNDPAQHVTTKLVSPQDVLPAWRLERCTGSFRIGL